MHDHSPTAPPSDRPHGLVSDLGQSDLDYTDGDEAEAEQLLREAHAAGTLPKEPQETP